LRASEHGPAQWCSARSPLVIISCV
jgi:hypothetical protein